MTPMEFNKLFNDLLNQANLTPLEEVLMEAPKYFGVHIPITNCTPNVPEDERKLYMVSNAAATTFLWLELARRGEVIPITNIELGSRTITRYALPGVEGYQFPKDKLGESEIHEEILAANKEILKRGRKFFTVIEDVILHVDPEIFHVSDGLIKHAKRIKAPAYNVAPDYEPGLPAAFVTDTMIVDVEERCKKDKWFRARMDGVAYAKMSDFIRHYHIPSSMRNATQHFTLRCADMKDGNITIGDELAKIGCNVMTGAKFFKAWKKLTGRKWKEGDPWMLIPSVTIKNFRGEGTREKAFIVHRSSFETGIQVIRASKTGHMTSAYWPSDAKNIAAGITDKVKHACDVVSDEILFKDYLMKHNVAEFVEEVTDDETTPKEKAILASAFRDASQLIAAGGDISDAIADVVKIVNAIMRSGFRDATYHGVNIKYAGHIDELPDGIEAIVPREYKFVIREHNHKRNTELEKFTRYYRDPETKELIGAVNLEKVANHFGYLVIMRPPIVNGYPTLTKDKLIFRDDINVVMMRSVHCKHWTMDMDGDFGLVTTNHPTMQVADYMELYERTMGDEGSAMMRRIEKGMNDIINDSTFAELVEANIPMYNGKPDSMAEGKKEADALAAEHGNLDMLTYIVDHLGAKEIGNYTNSVLDILMHWSGLVLPNKMMEFLLFGNMSLSIFSEGSIQRTKHPEIRLIFTPIAVRIFSGVLLKKLGIIDPNISDMQLIDDAPMFKISADKVTRYGARPVELVESDDTWSPNPDEQISNIFNSLKHKGEMKRNNLIPKLRPMNPREHLLWTHVQFNNLAGKRERYMATPTTVDPLYFEAARAINIDLTWMLKRNKELKPAIERVMWHIIAKFHATNRLLGDHPSIFAGQGIRHNGSLRFDAKHPVGRLFVDLTNVEKHEREIVPLIREHGTRYAVVALASLMYLRTKLGFNYKIMSCGFTLQELEIYMQLVKAEMGDIELPECEFNIDMALKVKGYKLLYVPAEHLVLNSRGDTLWINNELNITALRTMVAASKLDAVEFRRNLRRDRNDSLILMGDDHMGIITDLNDVLGELLALREPVLIMIPKAFADHEIDTKGAANVRIVYL